jgi:CheY-like chemotaxis protein
MAMILIVEDEIFVRDLAELMLADMGHSVLPAASLSEAVVILRSGQPIDLLITDIRLEAQILGGFEVARQALALRPRLPVLYVTGSPVSDYAASLFATGSRYLQKPYTAEQLQESLEKLLAAAALNDAA